MNTEIKITIEDPDQPLKIPSYSLTVEITKADGTVSITNDYVPISNLLDVIVLYLKLRRSFIEDNS